MKSLFLSVALLAVAPATWAQSAVSLAPAAASAGSPQAPRPLPAQAPQPATGASTVVAIVKVPKPWYAPRALVVSKMRDTVAQYASLPGLQYKAFSFAQADSQFGGIYLWQDRPAAQDWFSPAWFARVEKERGVKGQVRLLDAPVVLDNMTGKPTLKPTDQSVATLVTLATPAQVTRERLVREFDAALPTYRQVPGLLRKYFIITDDGQFGGVYLWDTPTSAQAWFTDAWHARVRNTYGADAKLEWFDTPIMVASKLTAP